MVTVTEKNDPDKTGPAGPNLDAKTGQAGAICDLPSENQPSSHIQFYLVNTP